MNAPIQGSAADIIKIAMIEVNKKMHEMSLKSKMVAQVHDELIGECPEENIKECSARLAEVMSKAAEELIGMPFSCDAEITRAWYGERVNI